MKCFVVLAVAIISVASAFDYESFFWRDFNGIAPKDAIKVYQKGDDEPFYIGQAYFPKFGLLPGMLRNGDKKMTVVSNGFIYTVTDNIKILASHSIYPTSVFQWIPINYQNLDGLKALNFLKVIKGGTENNSPVYIGRHSEPGYMNIGKIYTLEPYQGLNIPDAQGKATLYKNFEVLVMLNFDCSEGSSENSARMIKKKASSSPLASWYHHSRQ